MSRTGAKSNSTWAAATIADASSNGCALLRTALRKSLALLLRADHSEKNVRHRACGVKPGRSIRSFRPGLCSPRARLAPFSSSLSLFSKTRAPRRNTLTDELVSNHIRSLLATHLVDVVSSDQHTVKPWFDGKIDFAPEVRDLSAAGFPLEGGRLDYLHGRTVVALVYRRNKHPINLFIEPAATRDHTAPATVTRRGYNLLHWTQDGMDYWAVSDLNTAELREFAALFTS